MLKIGDFSKLAQVSVKTLRYYGERGLLNPAWIDRFTGYRYYTPEQLPRLNRILALKDLGFSLEQIGDLLAMEVSAVELRGMLRMKVAELEQLVQAEQARLTRIEARLHQIDQEGELPSYEVVLKSVPRQRILGLRQTIPTYEDIYGLFQQLCAHLTTQGVETDVTHPCFAIYYDPEYRERDVDVEVAAPSPERSPRARVWSCGGCLPSGHWPAPCTTGAWKISPALTTCCSPGSSATATESLAPTARCTCAGRKPQGGEQRSSPRFSSLWNPSLGLCTSHP